MVRSPRPRSLLSFLVFSSAASLAACGGGETTPASSSTGGAANPNDITFTVETKIDAGQETQLCKFVTMPTDRGEIAVASADHEYTEGSHHFLAFRTTETSIPAGGDQLVPCDETGWMASVRGVAYGAQSPTGSLELPDGVSQRFEPGEVLLLQVHYLNTSTKSLDAKVRLTFHPTTVDAAPTKAGMLFFYDPIIDVPAHGKSTSTVSCPIPGTVDLVFGTSHMHRRGVDYHAEVEGQAKGSLFTTSTWSSPIPRTYAAGEAHVAKGQTISYTCDYENDADTRVIAGLSAEKNEMCMFIGMYYPRLDDDTEFCAKGAVATQGTTSCMDTMKCATACAAGDDDCKAGCLDAICPTAAMPLMQLARCMGAAGCGETCKQNGADSSECKQCVTGHCLQQASACQAATCPAP